MQLRPLLFAILGSLLCASSAQADGPVFAIVSNTASTSSPVAATPPLNSPSSAHEELNVDRKALARVNTTQRRATAALARAEALSASAPLLSDQLAAEQTTAELQVRADNAAAQATELRQQIDVLTSELQPVRSASVNPLAATASLNPLLSTPADTTIGAAAVWIAKQYLGVPYRWGGGDPSTGFDCSGLTMYVYAQLGIPLRHYAADQWNDLPHVDLSQLEPGDLVFFEPRLNGPGHVGIYAGANSFIEAPHTGDVVKIASLSQDAAALGFVGAARPLTAAAATTAFGY
jgi:cell wall-associated NlpC family hydrolase